MPEKTWTYGALLDTLVDTARTHRTKISDVSATEMLATLTGNTNLAVRAHAITAAQRRTADYSHVPGLVGGFIERTGTAPTYKDMQALMQRRSKGSLHAVLAKVASDGLVVLNKSQKTVRIELPLTKS